MLGSPTLSEGLGSISRLIVHFLRHIDHDHLRNLQMKFSRKKSKDNTHAENDDFVNASHPGEGRRVKDNIVIIKDATYSLPAR